MQTTDRTRGSTHDERRQNEAKAVEKRIGDVDVEVLRHVIRLVQMHISAVEYTVMEWKYCGESESC